MKTQQMMERRSYSKIEREWDIQIPNLLDVQLQSFRDFLQMDLPPTERRMCRAMARASDGPASLSAVTTVSAKTAKLSNCKGFLLMLVTSPNGAVQRRAASDPRLQTGPPSARPLKQPGWVPSR